MNHDMHLDKIPFEMIENDIKNVEYRLNDDKRRKIKVGDTITFIKRPLGDEKIVAEVTKLTYYKDLLAMYTDTFDLYLCDKYKTPEEAVKDTPYYSEEEIKKMGCVTISFTKI